MRVVTGARGFIGDHVCHLLVRQVYDVVLQHTSRKLDRK